MSQPAPNPDRTTSISLDSSVFVGRQQEMAALEAALHDALSGQGRLVMLAGEPGIGKTRTAQELAAYAKEHGVQVLWGWCYEEEGAPPYWPWVRWTQSATCCGMPIETSKSPSTPTVTRVSRASRTVRRSSWVAESSRSRICSLRAFWAFCFAPPMTTRASPKPVLSLLKDRPGVPWRMCQRQEHLSGLATTLPDVVFDYRVLA